MRIFYFLIIIMLLPSLALANTNTNICVPVNNAPFAFIDSDGTLKGFDIDMLEAMQLSEEVTIQNRDFASSMAALGNAECDMVLSNVVLTPSRQERFLFSNSHIQSGLYAAVLKDSPINSIAELALSTVGVIKGSTAESYAFRQFEGSVIYAMRDSAILLNMLNEGSIEAILDSRPQLHAIQKNHNIRILEEKLLDEEYAYAFAKEHEDLRNAVNLALNKMQNDGSILKIYEKWFGNSIIPMP